ncbi:hypothetical protein P7K49_010380 [Saguinus oedipus]|uniref:Uncharacterized protein n=1 Tax=Saguinus oedipus TaxID=9490 RepID=A0ABQ9VP23_SAGOE|nr:hypothetical protein P7K49_010380 [Saguinus oedipus]
MAFVAGALGFWAPKFLLEAHVVHGLQPPCLQEPCSNPDSLIFGSLTIITGVIGVILGAEVAKRYKKVNPRAEPLICASSLLTAAPCLYLALVLAPTNLLVSYEALRVMGLVHGQGAQRVETRAQESRVQQCPWLRKAPALPVPVASRGAGAPCLSQLHGPGPVPADMDVLVCMQTWMCLCVQQVRRAGWTWEK